MGSQVTLLPELLRGFAREHDRDAAAMRRSLESGEFENALRHAHTLKGIAANLSLGGVREAAAAVEAALRKHDTREALLAVDRIEQGVAELSQALSAAPPTVQAEGSVLDRPAFVVALNHLQALLQASSFDADTQCQSLRPSLEWHLGADAARRILDPLGRFEFVSSRAAMCEAARGAGFELDPV